MRVFEIKFYLANILKHNKLKTVFLGTHYVF